MPFITDTPERLQKARESRRKHYKNNKEQYYTRIHHQHEVKRQYIIDIKKKSSCADCGTDNYICLEFDHLPQYTKLLALSNPRVLSWSFEKIDVEIAKCEIVCGNCHKIRTHNRRNRLQETDSIVRA